MDRRINQKLKHFEVALGTSKSGNKAYIEWVIQKLGSLNKQITTTNIVQLHRPDLIGSTALHLAYSKEDLEAFRTLIALGADCTLKNQKGFTALHLVFESVNKVLHSHSDWVGRLEDPFITAILAAHIEYKESANPCDPNGFSHFHAACMTNNIEAVEFFLYNDVSVHDGVNVNSNYFPGYTPLHFAVRHFNLQVVEVLLNRGASIHFRDAKGMTPLQILLKRNFEMVSYIDSDLESSIQQERNLSEKIARLMLVNTAGIDTMMIDDSGLSYLHVASALMDLSEVEKLLEKVTDINHCVNVESPLWAGYTALHFVAFSNVNIVKLLVRRGADLQAKDAKGVTPMDLCLERYKVEDICSILSFKAEWKDVTFSDGKTKLLGLISATKSYHQFKKFLRRVAKNKIITLPNNSPLWPGSTPMHLVVLFAKSTSNLHKKQREVKEESYLQMISDLFEKNRKMVETQDIHGRTPLHLCFRSGKMKNIVDLFLKLHQKLDNPHDFVDEDNLSLLHIACANNNENLVDKFLLHSNNSNLAYTGESIKKSIVRGWTPLHVAVIQRQSSGAFNKEQNRNVVKVLLKYGADVNAKDAHEITPVHLLVVPSYCGRHNYNDSVDDMLLSSPHLKEVAAGDFGLSHLQVACFWNKKDVVKKLVDQGADVNCAIKKIPKMYDEFDKHYASSDSTEYLNNTPLHISLKSAQRNKKTIEFLIRGGADIFAKNSKGVPLLYESLEDLNEDEDPTDSNIVNLKTLAKALREYENLRIQAEKDIGLTQLHIACRTNETSLIESLLDNGADVNAQISSDSLIWPGYTPLHVLIRYVDKYKDNENVENSMRLLLDRKADVTLPDGNQRTPIHMAYRHYIKTRSTGSNDSTFARPYTLLRAQWDFSINPRSIEGITHFHIACSLADVFTVKKFLKHGHVDVDQPIDFFQDLDDAWKGFRVAGCTPLHLAVMERYCGCGHTKYAVELTSPFETLDLLLKHGVDVDAENAWGETPFHVAACTEFRERLARSGANVNVKNAIGYTPLEDSLINRSKSLDEIQNLFLCGCRYNAFNSGTEIGCIGRTMRLLPLEKMQKLVSTVIMNYPNLMVDEMSRTVIHNLVSIYQINVSSDDYINMIEHFTRTGCDVDAQDKWGRTALHIAVKFKNLRAISGLLLAGVDINITDANEQTAFAHQFQPCTRCDQPTDAEDEQCEHYRVFKFLALQVKTLKLCGLDVHPMNEEIVAKAFPSFDYVKVSDQFVNELEEMNNFKFKSCFFTLHDFMSELDVVADYSTTSELNRNVIDEFFHPYEGFRPFREKYSEVAGLLRLQYRKAVKRTELLQKAKISLDLLADIRVPDLCSRIILRFLKNSELQNMITAS